MYVLFEELRDYDQFHLNVLLNNESVENIRHYLRSEGIDIVIDTSKLSKSPIMFKPIKSNINELDRALILIELKTNTNQKVEVVIWLDYKTVTGFSNQSGN